MKRYYSIWAIILIFLIMNLIWAQPPKINFTRKPVVPIKKRTFRPKFGFGFMRWLNLTEKQRKKIAEYRLELQKELTPLQSELLKKKNNLKGLLTSDKTKQPEISTMLKEIGQIQTQIQEKKIDHLLKVRKLLNDNQKNKFDRMILYSGAGMRWKALCMGRRYRGGPWWNKPWRFRGRFR